MLSNVIKRGVLLFCCILFGAGTGCVQVAEPDLDSLDQDDDGYLDLIDEFPTDAAEWADTDQDGIGNNADADDDADACPDAADVFPQNPLECMDTDNDGVGNAEDADDDGDGEPDDDDPEPLNPNVFTDTDEDGVADERDEDDDGDGILDVQDVFRLDATEWIDSDNDGVGNNADTDDDGDRDPDGTDPDPNDATQFTDGNNDDVSDNIDTDGDGVLDMNDECPLDNTDTVDTDNDGACNNDDMDDDGDGVADASDRCPLIAAETLDTDTDGTCNGTDTDDDGDGVLDAFDDCPLDPNDSVDTDNGGVCDNADNDDDNDGCLDVNDDWPLNNTLCVDTDLDGVANAADAFPTNPSEWTDADADGYGSNADCRDNDNAVNPNRHEICGNAKDDDCNAKTDEIGCMIALTGDTFDMGADADGDGENALVGQVHDVQLGNFYIDKYEVTNEAYKACVTAGSCTAPSSSNTYYDNATYVKRPVTYVSWSQANSYCSYLGKRLPTEAEWEFAARNGSNETTYPWGNGAIDTTKANYFDGANLGEIADVDQFSAGQSTAGVFNLVGNVDEWVSDFAGNYPLTADALVVNPTGPASGQITDKIHRGGNYSTVSGKLEGKDRYHTNPNNQRAYIGFRCADSVATKN